MEPKTLTDKVLFLVQVRVLWYLFWQLSFYYLIFQGHSRRTLKKWFFILCLSSFIFLSQLHPVTTKKERFENGAWIRLDYN